MAKAKAKTPAPAAPETEELDFERRVQFTAARRHSRIVRVLKLAFPVVAAALAIGFFAFSYVRTPVDIAVAPDSGAISNGKLVMANPKLEGLTKDKREYSMTAQRATQDIASPSVIELEAISAKLPFEEDKWVSIDAPAGTYDRDKNTLNVSSPFTVKTNEGWKATLQSAFMDITAGTLKSDAPVDILINGTRIQADSMSIENKGTSLVFDKRVKLYIEPSRLQQMRQANTN